MLGQSVLKSVLLFLFLPLLAHAQEDSNAAKSQASIEARLKELKESYRNALSKTNGKLVQAIDAEIAKAKSQGNVEETKSLELQRSAFLNFKDLPTTDSLQGATSSFLKEAQQHHATMQKLYENAIDRCTRQLKLDEATRIKEKMKSWQEWLPDYAKPSEKEEKPKGAFSRAVQSQAMQYEDAKDALLAELERSMKQSAAKADLEGAKLFKDLLEEMQDRDLLSTGFVAKLPTRVKASYQKYLAACDRSLMQLEAAYRKELTKAAREQDLETIRSLSEKFAEGLGVGPRRWTPLFVSSDPVHWNSKTANASGFAITLEDAPQEIRFLRLRRLDTLDAVIIPISYERLGQMSVDGRAGWQGTKHEQKGYYRLGVYHTGSEAKQKGALVVGSEGFTPFTGWGFATLHNVDSHQAYVWQGREIRPTSFEVSVTSGNLTAPETRLLLR